VIPAVRVGAAPADAAAVTRALLLVIAIGAWRADAAPRPNVRLAQAAVPRTAIAVVVRRQAHRKARAVIALPAQTPVKLGAAAAGWIAITATVGRRTITGFIPRSALASSPPTTEDDDVSEDGFAISPPGDPRTTIEAVVIRAKPGEKQAAVATIPPATSVTVLAERGRWLRIRAGTTVGYVTRTTITGAAPPTEVATPPNTPVVPHVPVPGWGDARGDHPSTAVVVYATARARLHVDANPTGALVGEVDAGARLDVLDARTEPGWVKVRDGQRRVGWIARGEVGNGSAQAAIDAPASTVTTRSIERTARVLPPDRLTFRVDAGLGYRTLGMDFTSPGDGLANYAADAVAAAGGVDADVVIRRGRLVLGGDARVTASYAMPGLRYTGPTAPPGDIAFSTLAVDGGVRAGTRLRDRFDLAARVGAHYDAFVTADVDNAGTLPRERLLGATLGARIDVSPPGSRVTASVRFDVLVAGDRAQTAGLEDGMSSSATALWGSATARYRLAAHLALQIGLELGRAATTWSGTSSRTPGVMRARRIDTTQLLQLGLSLEL
jgi:uncharacterized protein YgiM (DUF1202 family)